jgi:hypothetical protein
LSNGRPWLPHHTEILKRMTGFYGDSDTYTDKEIANTTGHSETTVKQNRLLLGIKPCKRIDWTKRRLDDR